MTATAKSAGQLGPSRSGGLVLVLNSGSSSVKFALLQPGTGERLMAGMGERLGTNEALLRLQWLSGAPVEERLSEGTHRAVVARVLGHMATAGHSGPHLLGVGHRVVHGGERFTESVVIDDDVLSAIRGTSHLAPLHNPANLEGIGAARAVLPDVPQVAVFDTAFPPEHAAPRVPLRGPETWYTSTAYAGTASTGPATVTSPSTRPNCSDGRSASCVWSPRTWATAAARPRSATAGRWTPAWG